MPYGMKMFTPEEVQELAKSDRFINKMPDHQLYQSTAGFTGYSLSMCLVDIMDGKVPLNNVMGIISSTAHSFDTQEEIDLEFDKWYRKLVYDECMKNTHHEEPALFMAEALKVFRELAEMCLQPRKYKNKAFDGHNGSKHTWLIMPCRYRAAY